MMIPLSVIDALIANLQSYSNFLHQHDIGQETLKAQVQLIDLVIIPNLEGIKKEAIVQPLSSTVVPLSQLEKIIDDARYAEDIEADLCELVNELKNKQEGNKPLEQRILQRIKELETLNEQATKKSIIFERGARIDELRKLLSSSTLTGSNTNKET